MKSILNIVFIDVLIYGWDNGFDILIDNGRLFIIISTPLSFHGKSYVRCTKKRRAKIAKKTFYGKLRHVPKT